MGIINKTLLCLALALTLPSIASAQSVKITGPGEYSGGLLGLKAEVADADGAFWLCFKNGVPYPPLAEGGTGWDLVNDVPHGRVMFSPKLDGRASYVFVCAAFKGTAHAKASHVITVGGPEPKPPKPPDPDDDDPEPDPDPDDDDPAPIPVDGFRVMVVYEKGAKENMPALQRAIIGGKDVAEYLNATCAVEPGNFAAYRFVDQNQDLTDDLKVWRDALARPRKSLPWVIISNGKTGIECALPATPSEFIELCKKYARPNSTNATSKSSKSNDQLLKEHLDDHPDSEGIPFYGVSGTGASKRYHYGDKVFDTYEEWYDHVKPIIPAG